MTKRAHAHLLGTQVYTALREDIITGRLAPEQRLTELAIARQMGTSQGPVREALKRLEEEGLVYSVTHWGTFVSKVDVAEMREVFLVRARVEGLMAAHAATRFTDADAERLAVLVQELVGAAATDDVALMAKKDLAFHLYVCQLSQHQQLLRIWRLLETQILRYAHVGRQILGEYRPADAEGEHKQMLEALRSGDPERARLAFEEHISWDKVEHRMRKRTVQGDA